MLFLSCSAESEQRRLRHQASALKSYSNLSFKVLLSRFSDFSCERAAIRERFCVSVCGTV